VAIALAAVTHWFGLWGGSSANDGVGSCWRMESGSMMKSVDCSDPSTQYTVVQEVSDLTQCPSDVSQYFDTKTDGPSRYQCLRPVATN
jgi:hypothetical protein